MVRTVSVLVALLGLAACAAPSLPRLEAANLAQTVALRGVNLAGAEFGQEALSAETGGEHGAAYVYPIPAYVDGYEIPAKLTEMGFNVFRLPFLWERMQPELGQPLDGAELERLSITVAYLNGLGAYVVIDPHNYARYREQVIGDGVSAGEFADFWRRLAESFKDQSGVVFGLMNEPHTLPTEDWVEAANAAIEAIRGIGASNLILVPGNHWTGTGAWDGQWYGTSNAEALLAIHDPQGFVAFEGHLYANEDSSGSTADCVDPSVAASRLVPFTNWLRTNGKTGFLGEFGSGPNANCVAAMDAMLRHVEGNGDVYAGWTGWAAGPWWPDDYHHLLEPDGGGQPQLDLMSTFLGGADGSLAVSASRPVF